MEDAWGGLPGIDRGRITEKRAGERSWEYRVESYTRGGAKTRWIETVGTYIHEKSGEHATDDKYEYLVGDEVFFFMFGDGRGMILGGMAR